MLASEIHFPEDLAAAVDLVARIPDALVFAGGSGIMRDKGDRVVPLPPTVICIHRIAELHRTSRSERFFEIGASVTLSELLEFAPGSLPSPLPEALLRIATHPIRNIATVGGNIAARDRFMDLWPVLACLDALVELRDRAGSKWVNINRLASQDGSPAFPAGTLLTRLRIPLESKDFHLTAKLGTRGYPAGDSSVFACMAKTDRGILEDFRLVHSGTRFSRFRDIETGINGRQLPLSRRETNSFRQEYLSRFDDSSSPVPAGFALLLDEVFRRLSR